MIYESFPWKQDLLQRKRLILKYNHSELLSEENDRAYTVIEKAIFYSAFIIRKLIDCKGKVSDEVDAYKFRIKGIRPIKEINLLNRWPDEDNYDWKHETVYTKSGTELCNCLIHSYCFFFAYNEVMEINSFFISSDYDRNKVLYCVELKDWLSYMEFVGKDYVKSASMESDDKEVDYVYTRKERGSLH